MRGYSESLRERFTGRMRWLLMAVTVAAAGLSAWAVWTAARWPDVAALRLENPVTTSFIERYREQERAAGRPDGVAWSWVSWDQISPWLKQAVLVAEDVEFFSHRGFSPHEARQAVREAIARRRPPRGASTLTQQLAKNLWLSPERSLVRKVREALLTAQLERRLEKRRILELYLNVAEFGPGVFGAEAASQRYFGVPAAALDESRATMLAAGLPRPSTWHPGSKSPSYLRRVDQIRDLMERISFLDKYVGLGTRPAGPDSVAPPDVDGSGDSVSLPDLSFPPE
jgi:monofunctional biosynthetic peptidoglycan transglycosylase